MKKGAIYPGCLGDFLGMTNYIKLPSYVGIISLTIYKDPSSNNQDSMEGTRFFSWMSRIGIPRTVSCFVILVAELGSCGSGDRVWRLPSWRLLGLSNWFLYQNHWKIWRIFHPESNDDFFFCTFLQPAWKRKTRFDQLGTPQTFPRFFWFLDGGRYLMCFAARWFPPRHSTNCQQFGLVGGLDGGADGPSSRWIAE